jgi:hypothetical protein
MKTGGKYVRKERRIFMELQGPKAEGTEHVRDHAKKQDG